METYRQNALADYNSCRAHDGLPPLTRMPAGTRYVRTTEKKAPKYLTEHIVQGNYGYGHGWEDECAEETRKEALQRLREYRENVRGTPYRLIRRRVLNPAYVAPVTA